jgi:hypothetical protein
MGVYHDSLQLGYPRCTMGDWWNQRDDLGALKGSAKSKTLKGQGGMEMITFAVVTFMKDQCRQEKI